VCETVAVVNCSADGAQIRTYTYGIPGQPQNIAALPEFIEFNKESTLSWPNVAGMTSVGSSYKVTDMYTNSTQSIAHDSATSRDSVNVKPERYGETLYKVVACNPRDACGAPTYKKVTVNYPLPVLCASGLSMATIHNELAWNIQKAEKAVNVEWPYATYATKYKLYLNGNMSEYNGTLGTVTFPKGKNTLQLLACNANGCSNGPIREIIALGNDNPKMKGSYAGMNYGGSADVHIGDMQTDPQNTSCDGTDSGLDLDCLFDEVKASNSNTYFYRFSYSSPSHWDLFGKFLTKLASDSTTNHVKEYAYLGRNKGTILRPFSLCEKGTDLTSCGYSADLSSFKQCYYGSVNELAGVIAGDTEAEIEAKTDQFKRESCLYLDFEIWAEAIAKLAENHGNLVGMGIDDFDWGTADQPEYYNPTKLKAIRSKLTSADPETAVSLGKMPNFLF
jgi:hypothetical protein